MSSAPRGAKEKADPEGRLFTRYRKSEGRISSATPKLELADFARLVSGDFHADANFASNGGGPSHGSLLFTSAALGGLGNSMTGI
jgi:hypothetical protein